MDRKFYLELIERYFSNHPIVAVLGPRQCGKTTLAHMLVANLKDFNQENYFDLENPLDEQRLANPVLSLKPLKGIIMIDEIQRNPELFSVLRYIADQKPSDKKFLILGSASLDLVKRSSESLTGTIAYMELTPFTIQEVNDLDRL